jgi:hypothetical protein
MRTVTVTKIQLTFQAIQLIVLSHVFLYICVIPCHHYAMEPRRIHICRKKPLQLVVLILIFFVVKKFNKNLNNYSVRNNYNVRNKVGKKFTY